MPSESHPVVVDFETEAIQQRPNYPPKPVGVAIKWPGQKARYYAFGHPEGNNCIIEEAQTELRKVWRHPGGVLFHNAKFDVDVAETHMGMRKLMWSDIHDTMMEVFLFNPDAKSHGLKQSAEELLGMPPEERDAVRDWLVKEHIVTRQTKDWGAFISKAPGDIVGAYAVGDVVRTEKLHTFLMPKLKKRKMLDALDRERKLMPCLLDMERHGIEVDLARLLADCDKYDRELELLSAWCLKRLKQKINLDSGEDLVAALITAEKVDLDLLGKTAKGAWRTDKESLAVAVTDKVLRAALNHRASLQTCLNFMHTWRSMAVQSGGRIFTTWNQLKQYGAKGAAIGAVTGRLSSSPNFQNIPTEFDPQWHHEKKGLPKAPLALSPLPLVRSYITNSPGRVLIGRDYSQQEIRILAHYEDGLLKDGYLQDNWMDAHATASKEIEEQMAKAFPRYIVKQINLGLIYGMGIDLMAKKAGCSSEEARAAKAAILAIYPGLRDLQNGLRDLAANNLPLRTWGGRQYFCEPPKLINEQLRTFEYKLLNRLVQGSAADCTKEAVIRYYEDKPDDHHLLLTVHDELLASVPEEDLELGMELLKACMESIEFEVPMLSEGEVSKTNWASMKPYDKKGVLV